LSFIDLLRKLIRKSLTGESCIVLENKTPSYEKIDSEFKDIDEFGLYLHIPFCRQICPYCPYNKEIYRDEIAAMYKAAIIKEVDIYSSLLKNKPVTSFYIGGGTPTTMLYSGLEKMLGHIFKSFNMQCETHMESHPNDLNFKNLDVIKSFGIKNLSIGVEALQDRHLKTLCRPYNTEQVRGAVSRAVNKKFTCLNTDIVFALPNQTYSEVSQSARELSAMGVDQVAAYPLFNFPYTKISGIIKENNYSVPSVIKRRKMIKIIENIFYNSGFERTSVWAFTKKNIPKYCSVTVPLYIGLGASGGSYLKNFFYLNTFNVVEYIKKLEKNILPIALSLNLSENMQMAWWFYWRIYETRFKRSDFKKRFKKEFNNVYGKYLKIFSLLGFIKEDDGDEIVLSDKGIYWLHVLEDLFSIDYISKLWGTSIRNPWPEKIIL